MNEATQYVEDNQMLEVAAFTAAAKFGRFGDLEMTAAVNLNGIVKVDLVVLDNRVYYEDWTALVETTPEEDALLQVWFDRLDWDTVEDYITGKHTKEIAQEIADALFDYAANR